MRRPIPIQDLNAAADVADGDAFPFLSLANGDVRRVAASVLAAYMSGKIVVTDWRISQYLSPNSSPYTATILPPAAGNSMILFLTPTGTLAVGTIVLPGPGAAVDKQEVWVTTTQITTALTVSAGTLSVVGAPTSLAVGGFFRMRYDGVNATWYRIG